MKSSPIDTFKKILVIDFGQIGDVMMSFQALNAIRERFRDSEIVVLAGKTPADLIREMRFADRVIAVDRVALLRGPKLRSIGKIVRLAKDIRRERFDLVIDLHSLYETNLLGFLSGARARLYANRESRSLDSLGNFRPRPPKEDKTIHLADNYLAVLKPLGIENADRYVRIMPDKAVADGLAKRFALDSPDGKLTVGMVIGAGHLSRRWPLENFAELAQRIVEDHGARIAVFLGPEEEHERADIEHRFPKSTTIVSGVKLTELAAAFSKIDLLVANDTGPPHLAALVGTPIVLIIDERGPLRYLPLTREIEVVRSGFIDAISVKDVHDAVERLAKKRTDEEEKPEEYQADQRQ